MYPHGTPSLQLAYVLVNVACSCYILEIEFGYKTWMLTCTGAVSPSFAHGDLSECPLCVPYHSLRVTTRLNPCLSGGLIGGGGAYFSSPNAPVMWFIVSRLNVLKMQDCGCNNVDSILCHCKKPCQ
jgi:hypothetical protein